MERNKLKKTLLITALVYTAFLVLFYLLAVKPSCNNVGSLNTYIAILVISNIVLDAFLFLSYKQFTNGHINFLISVILAINKYGFLLSQLVIRDFKSKYKRSVFGVVWSLLNPLLTMTIQFLVFSTIFNADAVSYPVYLLSGVICFNFFKECTEMCLISISDNEQLINKVYIPKYIFPIGKTISSSINLGLTLIPLLLVTLIMGIKLRISALMCFFFLACLIVFSMGIGMLLGALMVFFRDIKFLWGVIIQAWQYATPIFYVAEIVPEKFKFILRINPLYHIIGNFRTCLMQGISPEPIDYLVCLLLAVIAFLIGSTVFKKTQDKFTLYI